jgi:superfamily I DNA/RNA helicase
MSFKPSPQQQSVFDFVTSGTGNAFIVAVAGAGKTTTLIEACSRMAGKSVAFAAYNKKIADEIKVKVNARNLDVNVGTFHSYGFAAWRAVCSDQFRTRVQVDQYGKWDLLAEQLPEQFHEFVKKMVSMAKQRALGVFGSIRNTNEWYAIADHFNMWESLEEGVNVEEAIQHCIRTLEASNELGKKIIDFDDMIYLPVLRNANVYKHDWVLVDEAQDTNPARRALAAKMLKPGGRIIFVGDPAQAIYGFTGADADATNIIIKEFNCAELPLTVTYRCPQQVVKAAQQFVSHIQAHESAPEGSVERLSEDDFWASFSNLRQSDAILCRNTAPLVSLAYTLIRRDIPCHVEGRDIGAGLLVLVNKWKLTRVDAFLERLERWEIAQRERMKAKNNEVAAESITDKAETLRVMCEGCATLEEVRTRIKRLFQDTENGHTKTLTLSTVHKSKGREWGSVYVLDYSKRMPSRAARLAWEKEQEYNLIYVAFTRAQERLILVN